jgi:hypothetical protein
MTLGPGTMGGSIISENVTAKHLMNIKSLAFETNPVNKGNTVTSFKVDNVQQKPSSSSASFMKEIEERLKARAGNFPHRDSYLPVKGPDFKPTEKIITSAKSIETIESKTLGTGISEADVQKIMKEFKLPE